MKHGLHINWLQPVDKRVQGQGTWQKQLSWHAKSQHHCVKRVEKVTKVAMKGRHTDFTHHHCPHLSPYPYLEKLPKNRTDRRDRPRHQQCDALSPSPLSTMNFAAELTLSPSLESAPTSFPSTGDMPLFVLFVSPAISPHHRTSITLR